MAKEVTTGVMAVDRDHADVLKLCGFPGKSLVEFDLVWDTEAGKIAGEYTEIIIRLGKESLDVQIPEGAARIFWLELIDTIHEISDRADRPDAAA